MKAKYRAALLCILIAVVLPPLVDWKIHREIQNHLKVKISGDFFPALLNPSYALRNVRFEWPDKIRLFSGNLEIEYNPLAVLEIRPLVVHVTGENLQVQLLGRWAEAQGVGKTFIKKLDAKFRIDSRGLREVYLLKIDSPAFQFHIKESEILNGKPYLPAKSLGEAA